MNMRRKFFGILCALFILTLTVTILADPLTWKEVEFCSKNDNSDPYIRGTLSLTLTGMSTKIQDSSDNDFVKEYYCREHGKKYFMALEFIECEFGAQNGACLSEPIESTCIVPEDDLILTQDTTLCPGTFEINDEQGDGSIKIGSDNIIVTCENTHLTFKNGPYYSQGIRIEGHDGVTIRGCMLENFPRAIWVKNSRHFHLDNIEIKGSYYKGYIVTTNSHEGIVENVLINSQVPPGTAIIRIEEGSKNLIHKNTLMNTQEVSSVNDNFGIVFTRGSEYNIIKNNVIYNFYNGLSFLNSTENHVSQNIFSMNKNAAFLDEHTKKNVFFHNGFFDSKFKHVVDLNPTRKNQYSITESEFHQGNYWDNYCDQGEDLNDDSFADTKPYKFNTADGMISESVIDYGPSVKVEC